MLMTMLLYLVCDLLPASVAVASRVVRTADAAPLQFMERAKPEAKQTCFCFEHSAVFPGRLCHQIYFLGRLGKQLDSSGGPRSRERKTGPRGKNRKKVYLG